MRVRLAGKTYTAAVAPGPHYGESTFSLVIPEPIIIGTYPLAVQFTPLPGSSTSPGTAATTVVASNFSGTADAHLAISAGNNASTGAHPHSPGNAVCCQLRILLL